MMKNAVNSGLAIENIKEKDIQKMKPLNRVKSGKVTESFSMD